MGPAVSPIEKSLLRGKWTAQREDGSHPIATLAKAVVEGRFREALTSPAAQQLFRVPSAKFDQSFDQAFTLDVPVTAADEAELLRLTLAVACLHAFVQVNWTGPDLDVQSLEVISLESEHPISLSEADINQKAISELANGGEPAYHLTKVAAFLRLAQILLAAPYNHCQSASWWRLRTAFVHQQVLDEPVPLPSAILTSLEPLTASFPSEPDLVGRLILEKGLLEHQFSHDKSAAELFVEAAKATGLEYELTGALGKRTKFQQFELSQLVLLADSHLADDDHNEPDLNGEPSTKITDETAKAPDESEARPNVPETLALNDDTLLEQTEFTSSNPSAPGSRLGHIDPSAQPPLHPLDQCILLSMCLNVKNTSPSHGLTNEQMTPYVARVISHPRNWSIHTMALLLRSRLESARTRTVERSTLQLQALIDQMPTADSALPERLLYFHSIPLPSKWELERELAMRFLSLGVVKSALEIFERLEMWEEVVKCWGALERPEKAIAIVRDLLEGRKAEAEEVLSRWKKTPADTSRRQVHDKAREAKLWCLLGDLEPQSAVAHYERAWTVSGGSSGRAMRSLGGYHFARGAYAEAIVCLKRAVAINPLLARSWFILGCACMRVEAWEEAKGAFTRCVAIDEDDGESWNNLASMYLRIGTSTSTAAGKEKKDSEEEEESTVGDGEAQTSPATQIMTSKSIPFANKLLAFRALKQGLRFSYDNWRMWYNYMIVAMDVGELAEAARALGRVVEETSAKTGADAVDEDVLERLVDAVTRAHVDPTTEAGAGAGGGDLAAANPNEGHGLLRSVKDLFDRIILPRVSSPRIFRAYARLLTWEGRWGDALTAHMDAYRGGVAGTMERGETDVEKWREAVGEVEEIVDVLINFGPRVEDVAGQEGTGKKWKLQARSIVRTFMGRTRENFEDEPEWGRLERLLEEVA